MSAKSLYDVRRMITIDKGNRNMNKHHIWLGTNSVQPKHNRVVAPQTLFEPFDILSTEDPAIAYWGLYPPEHRAVISRIDNWFGRHTSTDKFTYIDNTSVQTNRVVTIPLQFFPDVFTGTVDIEKAVPEQYGFKYGETLHFVAPVEWARWRLCYVMKDQDGRDFVNQLFSTDDSTFMTDGGDDRPEIEVSETDNIIPEALVKEGEVLVIETGEVTPADDIAEQYNELATEDEGE